METHDYKDNDGRLHRVIVPDGCPEDLYPEGIPVGPPDLALLGLPLEIEVRLHNQLYSRRLFNLRDVLSRPKDIQGALQAALKLDMQIIQGLYKNQGG